MNEPYVGNAAPADIAARLRAARRAVVVTHTKPDGDAIGSVLAVLRLLRAGGAQAQAWLVGPVDHALRVLLAGETVGDARQAVPSEEPDLIVVVDTGSWSQLDAMASWIRPRRASTVLVDHHRGGDPAVAAMRLIDTRCASTTQLLLSVVDALGIELGGGGEGSIAEALFVGLATDTGWFRFSNADAPVFETAARLLREGVSKDRLYRMIEETARPERMRLLARALGSMQLCAGGRASIMVLTGTDFSESGGGAEDLAGIINEPMAIGTLEVSVLVSENEPGMVKLSFRSKPPMRAGATFVDVNAFAAMYGGGGHVHAAGAKIKGTLADAMDRVRRDLDALP